MRINIHFSTSKLLNCYCAIKWVHNNVMNDIFENLRKSGFPSIKTPIKNRTKIWGVDFFLVNIHTPRIISVNFQLSENFLPQKSFIDRTISGAWLDIVLLNMASKFSHKVSIGVSIGVDVKKDFNSKSNSSKKCCLLKFRMSRI